MSSPAVYRFLPWSRRGLVAELRDSAGAASGPLPFRSSIKLDVTLSRRARQRDHDGRGGRPRRRRRDRPARDRADDAAAARVERRAELPRRRSTSTTPTSRGCSRRPPANSHGPAPAVGRPRRRRGPARRLDLGARRSPAAAAADRVGRRAASSPTSTDSWAWAHTQLLVERGLGRRGGAGAPGVRPRPHVSRLVCPRRLRPDTRWHACLVPAFDAGVGPRARPTCPR